MGIYEQRCPDCQGSPYASVRASCLLCGGQGRLRGNGSAQVNPVRRRSVLAADGAPSQAYETALAAAENVV